MPRHSLYRAAVADDEDTAQALLDIPSSGDGPATFGLAGWTHERELLVGLTEAVLSLRSVVIAVNSKSGKPPKVNPLPRPKTALDRVQAQRSKQKRSLLIGQLVPDEADQQT